MSKYFTLIILYEKFDIFCILSLSQKDGVLKLFVKSVSHVQVWLEFSATIFMIFTSDG
jgi:hypothetical protein